MHLLLNLFWFYPALIALIWTVVALVIAGTTKLNRPITPIAGLHPLLFLANPKDEILYARPSLMSSAAFLLALAIPLVALALLLFYAWWMLAIWSDKRKPRSASWLTKP